VGAVQLNKRFKVERESGTESLELVTPPFEGAWQGAYLGESQRAQIGWFLTLVEAPLMIEGHPIRLLAATEQGVAGHLIILDGS
jgi:hypothetical protein